MQDTALKDAVYMQDTALKDLFLKRLIFKSETMPQDIALLQNKTSCKMRFFL